ncbi:MAG: regulatory protein GemA [Rubrivivax sp.]|nr:regulatory protein GemA [Rubrivivax sp.]
MNAQRKSSRVLDDDRSRRADLAAIHVAKKALAWNEDEYRDIMATVCGGVRSAGALDFAGRKRFMAHQQACLRANGHQAATKPTRAALAPHERKMWSLWMQLADAGLVNVRSMKALQEWTLNQIGVDSTRFMNRHQKELAIERLKEWLKSRGVAPK